MQTIVYLVLISIGLVSTTNQKHGNIRLQNSTAAGTHVNDVISDWELDLPRVDDLEAVETVESSSGTDTHSVATHADMELILAELGSVSQQITSLRTQVGNLKYQNHVMYKQLKKVNNRCAYPAAGNNHGKGNGRNGW